MSDTVIKVEEVGKLYKLGEIGTGTLSHDLNRWWARVRGKEDPFAKIGEINDRTSKGSSDYVWALKDVSFEVKQGEVLGIIGRNGAGKSTLLKILSKVTTPSHGRIKVKGRIASLLEVGTGFHPELTGRENIFLNGAILGMTKGEIKKKFDEIVDFAGVERYIDTPVKRYSSGMYVRLAFAVAAFLEPEILIVDEVLAVGDAEFQKKCLGRMKDVSTNDGRTVLFVSHNMASLQAICKSGLLMQNGTVQRSGSINEVITHYTHAALKGLRMCDNIRYFSDQLRFTHFSINETETSSITLVGNRLKVKADFSITEKMLFDMDIHIKQEDVVVASFGGFLQKEMPVLAAGAYSFTYDIELPPLRTGMYQIDVVFTQPYTRWWAILENLIEMEVFNTESDTFLNNPNLKWGKVLLNGKADVNTLS
jgi:lipopolysaccharide transport system ATP-binding protein